MLHKARSLLLFSIMGFHLSMCTSTRIQAEDFKSPFPASKELLLPSPNFKVAYVGDQGSTAESVRVLKLVKSEGADLFVIAGDFDYKDDPKLWDKMLTENLGNMPVLGVVGNHDVKKWDEYEAILRERLSRMPKAHCWGEVGVKLRCEYEGIVFALSGVGTLGSGHDEFLHESLQESPAAFKVCVWHKNQRLMQAGTKNDEVGWNPYEICLKEGAMVATGHEHSYARTHLLSSFAEQTVVHREKEMVLEKGQSMAFVSGLGGKSIRPQANPSWWNTFVGTVSGKAAEPKDSYFAKIYTATQNAKHAVVFCTYHIDNDPRKAHCYYKNIDGEIIDEWNFYSKVDEVSAPAVP